MKLRTYFAMACMASSLTLASTAAEASGGRLLATGGVTTIEGTAGGGIVPWAVLGSYAEDDEWGATVTMSRASVDDFRLNVTGVNMTWRNRVEFSAARQTFELNTIGGELNQNIFGVKYRVAGDLIYGSLPQISAVCNTNTTLALAYLKQ